jgi:hypothetical protein
VIHKKPCAFAVLHCKNCGFCIAYAKAKWPSEKKWRAAVTYTTVSQLHTERRPSRFFKAVSEFVSAWAEASAAYAVYRELAPKSRSALAAKGLRREDIGRHALDLPKLPRD